MTTYICLYEMYVFINLHNIICIFFLTKSTCDMNISMECNNVNVNESFKQDLLEGKYDQM